jgi:hypothetical protein
LRHMGPRGDHGSLRHFGSNLVGTGAQQHFFLEFGFFTTEN